MKKSSSQQVLFGVFVGIILLFSLFQRPRLRITQVVELGAADFGRPDKFQLGDHRRMDRVNAFNAYPFADFPDGKRGRLAGSVFACNYDALEHLEAFFLTFFDFLMDSDGLAGSEIVAFERGCHVSHRSLAILQSLVNPVRGGTVRCFR